MDCHEVPPGLNARNSKRNIRRIASSVSDTVEIQSPRTIISCDRLFIDYAEPIAAKVVRKWNGVSIPFDSISKSEENSLTNCQVSSGHYTGFSSLATESSVTQSIKLEESSDLLCDENYVAPFGKIFRLARNSFALSSRHQKPTQACTTRGKSSRTNVWNINTGNRYNRLIHVNCKSETKATFTSPPSCYAQEVQCNYTKYLISILLVPEVCILMPVESLATIYNFQFTTDMRLSEEVYTRIITKVYPKISQLGCEANAIKPALQDATYFKVTYSSESDELDVSPSTPEPLMSGDVAHVQHELPLSKFFSYSSLFPTITTSELTTELAVISNHQFSFSSKLTNISNTFEPKFVTCTLSETTGLRTIACFYLAREDTQQCCHQSSLPKNMSYFTGAINEYASFLSDFTVNISESEERKSHLKAAIEHGPLVPFLQSGKNKTNVFASSAMAISHAANNTEVDKTTPIDKYEAKALFTSIQYLKLNGQTYDSIPTLRWIKARSNVSRERQGNDITVVDRTPVWCIEQAISVRNTNMCYAEEVHTQPVSNSQPIGGSLARPVGVWLSWLQQSSVVAFSGLAIKSSIFGVKTSDLIPLSGVGVALAICALICYGKSR